MPLVERMLKKNQTQCQPMHHNQGSASPFQGPIRQRRIGTTPRNVHNAFQNR